MSIQDDPIVEEIRQIRLQHAKKFNYDLDAIVDDLKKKEALHPERLITPSAKQLLCAAGA